MRKESANRPPVECARVAGLNVGVNQRARLLVVVGGAGDVVGSHELFAPANLATDGERDGPCGAVLRKTGRGCLDGPHRAASSFTSVRSPRPVRRLTGDRRSLRRTHPRSLTGDGRSITQVCWRSSASTWSRVMAQPSGWRGCALLLRPMPYSHTVGDVP